MPRRALTPTRREKMKRHVRIIAVLAIAFAANWSGFTLADDSSPVIPAGFNRTLLDILACPENLTPVHFATQAELSKTNARIKAKGLKTWGGKIASKPVDAMLIREDGKIAYRV